MVEQESSIKKELKQDYKTVENNFNHVKLKKRKDLEKKESKYLKALTTTCLDARIINSCFSLYFLVFSKIFYTRHGLLL